MRVVSTLFTKSTLAAKNRNGQELDCGAGKHYMKDAEIN